MWQQPKTKGIMNPEQYCTSPSYFDREFSIETVKILPGEYYATAESTAISTLLGSCVSVCLYDRGSGVGGMNHFMLPQILQCSSETRCADSAAVECDANCSARYGSCAMRRLLSRLKELGARIPQLEAKIFGAGRVLAHVTDVGEQNATFALGYLKERGIPVVAQDLGDSCPRKIVFFPATGRALVKRLRELPAGLT